MYSSMRCTSLAPDSDNRTYLHNVYLYGHSWSPIEAHTVWQGDKAFKRHGQNIVTCMQTSMAGSLDIISTTLGLPALIVLWTGSSYRHSDIPVCHSLFTGSGRVSFMQYHKPGTVKIMSRKQADHEDISFSNKWLQFFFLYQNFY